MGNRTLLTVIVPTVPGREESLDRAIRGFTRETPLDLELIVIRDSPTCGWAWREGAKRSSGDYLYYGADDVEPGHGWAEPLIEAADQGFCPTAVIYNPDGTLQSAGLRDWDVHVVAETDLIDWTPVQHITTPFMTRGQYEALPPMLPLHYSTDIWHSHCCRQLGIEPVLRSASTLLHYNHDAGRGAGMTQHDRARTDQHAVMAIMAGEMSPDDLPEPA